jgi:hypothetical protein
MYRHLIGIMPKTAGFDSDAQAFFTATGITDATIKTAINNLVVAMKGYSIWTKCDAIYPFVGGSAALHKWNLKNPVDADAQFRIVFSGTATHDANGYTPNGTTGYGDTKYNGNTAGRNDNSHLSVYVRTNTAAADKTEISAYNGGGDYWAIKARQAGDTGFYGMYNFATNGFIQVAGVTDARGFHINSRRGATDGEAYTNGVSIGTDTSNSGPNIPNVVVHIGKRSDSAASFTDRNIAFASMGQGLTDTEAANYYTAVQAFQTTLSRQV